MLHRWVNYQSLRSDISFVKILRHYLVDLKERGDQRYGFCPLPTHPRESRSSSFSVNVENKTFRCSSCGLSGNLLEFAALMEGLNPKDTRDFRKVALFLKNTFLKGATDEIRKAVQKTMDEHNDKAELRVKINAPLDFEFPRLEHYHPYLLERGFSLDTIKTFGLGYCRRGLMKERIAIPLHDAGGTLIGYAGRIVDEEAIGKDTPQYLFPGSRERNGTRHVFRKSAFLYNGFRVAKASRLVVVESFTGVWWLTQAGIPNVVALMGASCSETQADLLRDLVPEDGSIWLFPDGDKAGERMAEETLVMLAPYRFVRWLKLAEGEQPTDLSLEELHGRLHLP